MKPLIRFSLAMLMMWPAIAFAHGVVMVPVYIPEVQLVPAAQTGNYSGIHTVAVLSAIGTTLTMRNNHFMGPKTKGLYISDWKIDGQITAMLRQYLGAHFAFKDVTYDEAALAYIPNGPMDNSKSALRKFLGALDSEGVDAFIVVRPDLEYQTPGLSGLALENGNGIGDPPPAIWANYEIDIVDARTLEILAKACSRVQLRAGEKPSFAALIGGPELKLSDDLTPNDQQRLELKTYVSKLVAASLIETLRVLNLGVAFPDAGARTLIPIPPGKDPFPAIKTVAVASMIDDQTEFEHLGGTIMSRGESHLPVADWKLDEEVESQARVVLAKRFTVKNVPVYRAALMQARLLDADNKLSPSFPDLSTTADVDAYVLFLKLQMPVWGVVKGNGLGVWNHTPISGDENTAVYANYVVALVDTHTLKLIEAHVAVTSPDRPNSNAYQQVENALWPAAPPTLSPDEAQKIHLAMTDLLDDTVQETLFRMILTGTMVADSPPTAPSQTLQQ